MVDAISTAVSGFQGAVRRFDISANNIASGEATPAVVNGTSGNTPFVAQTVQSTNAPTGTSNSSIRSVTPATIAGGASGNSSTTDTAQQLLSANIASYDARGNIAVIKSASKTYQDLLNIVS